MKKFRRMHLKRGQRVRVDPAADGPILIELLGKAVGRGDRHTVFVSAPEGSSIEILGAVKQEPDDEGSDGT